jgi:hypothetical protein
VLAASLFYFVLLVTGAIKLLSLLNDPLPIHVARIIVLGGSATLLVLGLWAYVSFTVNLFSRSYMGICGPTLIVRGPGRIALVEKNYLLTEIECASFGKKLNIVEAAMSRLHEIGLPRTSGIMMIRHLKEGQLIITDKTGGKSTFFYLNDAFDSSALAQFAVELVRRGVKVCSG